MWRAQPHMDAEKASQVMLVRHPYCHPPGNPGDKGTGMEGGQCLAEDGSDSVRARLRPGMAGKNMKEER